jgi:hypothetical protein
MKCWFGAGVVQDRLYAAVDRLANFNDLHFSGSASVRSGCRQIFVAITSFRTDRVLRFFMGFMLVKIPDSVQYR